MARETVGLAQTMKATTRMSKQAEFRITIGKVFGFQCTEVPGV
jgi:hypothetical protein